MELTSSLVRSLMAPLGGRLIHEGSLLVTFPDGRSEIFGDGDRQAELEILDNRFFVKLLRDGEIGFGEAYMEGYWRSPDIVGLLRTSLDNRRHQGKLRWLSKLSFSRARRLHEANRNTRERARENMHAHYDLSNDFYRVWLDERFMSYSCAVFADTEQSLEEAQENKQRILCTKAGLDASHEVLDIGGGWGGFSLFAAAEYGCRVTMANIAQAQVDLARERVKDSHLDSLVDVRLCDYRDIEGSFDRVFVIGMIEQVGAEYYETLFQQVDRLLRAGGRFILQTITVPHESFALLRDGVNFFQKHIFPGGMLPSVVAVKEAIAATSLELTHIEEIGQHYGPTMRHWRTRFMARLDEVRALGFDQRFIRMWEYYLAASEALFENRETGDSQMVFVKPG